MHRRLPAASGAGVKIPVSFSRVLRLLGRSMSELSHLALPHIAKLHAYTPGLQPTGPGWVKLNTNECPYPPSPRVAEALQREISTDGAALRLYPNPKSSPLRTAVAQLHAREYPPLREENVIIGNGSDDILNLPARAFVDRGVPRSAPAEPPQNRPRLTGDSSPYLTAAAGFTLP